MTGLYEVTKVIGIPANVKSSFIREWSPRLSEENEKFFPVQNLLKNQSEIND